MKVDEFNSANIENGMNYKFDKYFFSGDKIRAVIIVYIIIFNILYINFKKKAKKKNTFDIDEQYFNNKFRPYIFIFI